MSRAPKTLAIVDSGGATISVSLLARVENRWRLLGTLAGPAGTSESSLLAVLAARGRDLDAAGAASSELADGALDDMPRLSARSRPPSTLLVLGASRRTVAYMTAEAHRTAWRVASASTETHDPREMTELALGREVGAILIGFGDPPGPDERAALDDLAALAGAIARRRPELRLFLGGPIRTRSSWLEAIGEELPGDPERITQVPSASGRRSTTDTLRRVLDDRISDPADGRWAVRRSVETLADLLDRRVELLEIGFDGGARFMADPGAGGMAPVAAGIVTAQGALVFPEPDDESVDAVLAWTTGSLDRHRMGDRLRELRSRPWVDAAGDGARLRLAAASAALARIEALTPELADRPAADLTVVAGGAFATAPASAISLAIADTIRRAGVSQLAWDHARLLGPIGTIEDPGERRTLLADVLRDAIVPLGTVVVAGGVGASRAPGRRGSGTGARLDLEVSGTNTRRDLAAGELAFIDLPPGQVAEAQLEFSQVVRFGKRTRRISVPVSGGLAGLILDLRDVPLRLPERRDLRRSRLAEWSALAWPRDDR